MEEHSPQQRTTDLMRLPLNGASGLYPLLLTEDELVQVLRIPEISREEDYHHVIENLKRMHGLPCVHISKTPLYPYEAIRRWIR